MNPKVRITGHYDDHGCHTIEAVLAHDGITRSDVADIIRAIFHPGAIIDMNAPVHEIGQTENIPRIAETVTAVTATRQHFGG